MTRVKTHGREGGVLTVGRMRLPTTFLPCNPAMEGIFLGIAMTKRRGLIALFNVILAMLVFVTPIGPLPRFFIGGQPTPVRQT